MNRTETGNTARENKVSANKLKKLKRKDLLRIMLRQQEEIERLEAELKLAQEELDSRRIRIAGLGSIAEASLELNKVFEAAQAAADQYIENARMLAERQDVLACSNDEDSAAYEDAEDDSVQNEPPVEDPEYVQNEKPEIDPDKQEERAESEDQTEIEIQSEPEDQVGSEIQSEPEEQVEPEIQAVSEEQTESEAQEGSEDQEGAEDETA